MNQATHFQQSFRSIAFYFLLIIGIGLLLAVQGYTWLLENFFTESHLAGYYCCAMEQDLPEAGTLARSSSDFFATVPGKYLPALLFAAGFLILFGRSLRLFPARQRWIVPFLFLGLNLLYLVVAQRMVIFSWYLSQQFSGHATSPYRGYDQTWYGIVGHLLVWLVFFVLLVKVPPALATRIRKSA